MPDLLDPLTIERLARLLTEGGLTELTLEHDQTRLRLVRTPAAAHIPAHTTVVQTTPLPTTPALAPARPAAEAPPPEGAVKSPMVGIAYLAPEPGAPPYITLGQSVAAGQTLLLIEAMKTFNQIKSPRAGTVTQILVAPGAPVEYDQPLLVIT